MPEHNLRSMTAYGRAELESPLGRIGIELRAVNNRFQDVGVTLPRELGAFETPLRNLLKGAVARGKIDCRVQFRPGPELAPSVTVNIDLARAYVEHLRALQQLGQTAPMELRDLTSLPGVLETQSAQIDENALWDDLRGVLETALTAFVAEQRREGAALGGHLSVLLGELAVLVERVERGKGQVVEAYRARLHEKLAELDAGVRQRADEGRLELEIAMFADKCDIDEELVRLRAHIERFGALIRNAEDEPAGKNMDFVVQEFVREVNTICSKARNTDVLGLGLEMKSTVERIKEQVQNVL